MHTSLPGCTSAAMSTLTILLGLVKTALNLRDRYFLLIFSPGPSSCHSNSLSLLPFTIALDRILAWLRSLPPRLSSSSLSPMRHFMHVLEPKGAAGKEPSCWFGTCELFVIRENHFGCSCCLHAKPNIQHNKILNLCIFFLINQSI